MAWEHFDYLKKILMGDVVCGQLNELSKWCNQNAWANAHESAIYSISMQDNAMECCFQLT